MNCQEFENNIEGLARGALADAVARAEALSHEEACGICAARLADERKLSAGLRALASGMKDAEPAARVESALLTAFRARAVSVAAGKGVSSVAEKVSNADNIENVVTPLSANIDNVVPLSVHSKPEHWSWVKTLAVASLAAAAALALFVLVRPDASRSAKNAGQVAGAPAALKEQSNTQGNMQQTIAQGNSMPSSAAGVAQSNPATGEQVEHTTAQQNGSMDKLVRASLPRRTSGSTRPLNAVFNAGGAHNPRVVQAPAEGSDTQQEIATDFIPLMQGAHYAQAEGGHLVRVELPRSALASFGLPVNAEAAGGRVKADVLLGDDGLARAIRFVR
jgi:hypothetical protein